MGEKVFWQRRLRRALACVCVYVCSTICSLSHHTHTRAPNINRRNNKQMPSKRIKKKKTHAIQPFTASLLIDNLLFMCVHTRKILWREQKVSQRPPRSSITRITEVQFLSLLVAPLVYKYNFSWKYVHIQHSYHAQITTCIYLCESYKVFLFLQYIVYKMLSRAPYMIKL